MFVVGSLLLATALLLTTNTSTIFIFFFRTTVVMRYDLVPHCYVSWYVRHFGSQKSNVSVKDVQVIVNHFLSPVIVHSAPYHLRIRILKMLSFDIVR